MAFRLFLLAFILFTSLQSAANKDTTIIYFDSEWHVTKVTDVKYFRKLYRISKILWGAEDYYIEGQLQMKGSYLDKKCTEGNGHFKWYFKNGNVMREGENLNSIKVGKWIDYHENGDSSNCYTYNASGKLEGEGYSWYEGHITKSKENFKNGKRIGVNVWYYENGQIASKEKYELGELVDIDMFEADGSRTQGSLEIGRHPIFKDGGVDGMLRFLNENIVYPKELAKRGISGLVKVGFWVETDGSISNVKIEEPSTYYEFNKEAARIVLLLPPFYPGRHHNLNTRLYFVLPVRFNAGR